MSSFNPSLNTHTFGKKLIHFPTIDSTNNFLFNEYEGPFTEGVVVIADHQTAGKGRMNRSWHSNPDKSLMFSILLFPNIKSDKLPQLTQITALAVTKSLEALYPVKPMIKWPNDIYINDKKCCGILSEIRFHDESLPQRAIQYKLPYVVLGIGINLNQSPDDFPDELKDIATSVSIESDLEIKRELIFSSILYEMEKIYYQWIENKYYNLLKEIGIRFYLKGKDIEIQVDENTQIKGHVQGLNNDGYLLIKDSKGKLIPIISGDIKICS